MHPHPTRVRQGEQDAAEKASRTSEACRTASVWRGGWPDFIAWDLVLNCPSLALSAYVFREWHLKDAFELSCNSRMKSYTQYLG
jgi:hypothetical protein